MLALGVQPSATPVQTLRRKAPTKITFPTECSQNWSTDNGTNLSSFQPLAMAERRRRTLAEIYAPYLRKFMSWKDGQDYIQGTQFSQEQLLAIRPHQIVRYMSLLAYGTEVPTPDMGPVHRRSSGLEVLKKALSFFMPNQNAKWNVESETGNPTMSVAVNALIKRIKKDEVRKRGKPSNAKRDLKRPEYRKTLRLLEAHPDSNRKFRIPCMMKMQFHIIGRADDISNQETVDIRQHDKFKAFALQTKVSWSKNVMEERACPDQILLAAMDADFVCCWALVVT